MERSPVGGRDPADLAGLLGATEIIHVGSDDFDDEYLRLLWAHPGFRKARKELRLEFAELEEGGIFLDESDRDNARKGPADAPYPLREFAEKWGVSPAAAYVFTRASDENHDPGDGNEYFEHFRREANSVIVWEDENGFTLYIPRPLTPQKQARVRAWMARPKSGHLEHLWSRGDLVKWTPKRGDPSALAWFERWQYAKEEPMTIANRLIEEGEHVDPETLVKSLTSIWKRMQAISEDGLRQPPPSRGRA